MQLSWTWLHLTWLDTELQELFVQAKATPMKPLQVEGNAERETPEALPGQDLASRGQQRDLKDLVPKSWVSESPVVKVKGQILSVLPPHALCHPAAVQLEHIHGHDLSL